LVRHLRKVPERIRLTTVVTSPGMGIAKDAAYRGSLGVGFMTVLKQALLAEVALAASDIERHQHMIAAL
jgi:hypothetical protein